MQMFLAHHIKNKSTMNEINFIEKQIDMNIEAMRPPLDIRDQMDIGYRFEKNTLEVFELRPDWQDESKKIETPVAKSRYVKTQKVWKIYWMRGTLKWEGYKPKPEVKTIQEFFQVLNDDTFGCFWG